MLFPENQKHIPSKSQWKISETIGRKMEYSIILTDRAAEETTAATDYYDQINSQLGTRFLTELSEIYEKLSVHPQLYSFVLSSRKSNIRDVKFPSFPYLVVYEVREKKVMIISVLNTNRKPLFHR